MSGHIVEGVQEDRIVYTYVKQAFLKAYLGAWQKYAKGGETAEPQFLVIEEINRGNCAQIFGDLFQLLDRSDNGFSTYPIEADSDLQNEIRKAFAEGGEYAIVNELDVDDAVDDYTSNYGKTLSDDIKSGRVLLLPNNLYIWATMNTSVATRSTISVTHAPESARPTLSSLFFDRDTTALNLPFKHTRTQADAKDRRFDIAPLRLAPNAQKKPDRATCGRAEFSLPRAWSRCRLRRGKPSCRKPRCSRFRKPGCPGPRRSS